MYGKYLNAGDALVTLAEPSPRVWETLHEHFGVAVGLGAIPACMGNILPDKGKYPTKPRNTFTMSSQTWGGSNILLNGDPQASLS